MNMSCFVLVPLWGTKMYIEGDERITIDGLVLEVKEGFLSTLDLTSGPQKKTTESGRHRFREHSIHHLKNIWNSAMSDNVTRLLFLLSVQ